MQDDTPEKLSGQVEADETLIGGKARFMHQKPQGEDLTPVAVESLAGKTSGVARPARTWPGEEKPGSDGRCEEHRLTEPPYHQEVRQRLDGPAGGLRAWRTPHR